MSFSLFSSLTADFYPGYCINILDFLGKEYLDGFSYLRIIVFYFIKKSLDQLIKTKI